MEYFHCAIHEVGGCNAKVHQIHQDAVAEIVSNDTEGMIMLRFHRDEINVLIDDPLG